MLLHTPIGEQTLSWIQRYEGKALLRKKMNKNLEKLGWCKLLQDFAQIHSQDLKKKVVEYHAFSLFSMFLIL